MEGPHISFSAYSLYRSCPFRWHLRYIKELLEPTNEFLTFGKALHETIEKIIREKPNRILYTKLFATNLAKNSNETIVKSYFGKNMVKEGAELLAEFDYFNRYEEWDRLVDSEGKIVGIEEQMFEPLLEYNGQTIYFKGFIDHILKHKTEDKYLILDWKTGLNSWNLEKKHGLISFEQLYEKIKNNTPLTKDEIEELQLKIFFGQLALYKEYYSKKYNIGLEKILTGYCVFVRQPVNIQEYDVTISKEFLDFILNDIKRVAVEIANYTSSTILDKAKTIEGLKTSCKWCPYKKDECNKK